MSSSAVEAVLARVAKRIVPSRKQRDRMNKLAEKLTRRVDMILRDTGFNAEVSIQGSFARDTWLSTEADLDIFARFPPSMDRSKWIDQVLPAIRSGLSNYPMTERYAEHPFLEFYDGPVRVNIVPCYKVEKGQWKSATDRSPFHTEYMKARLTPPLRLEARLTRRFMKGIQTYGAEIRVGGFSGMLAETLTLAYGSFADVVKNVSDWNPPIFLQLENTVRSGKVPERLQSNLVVIDPVDPGRNLAAAVTPSKLWTFVAASREFVKNPQVWYFYPPTFTPKNKAQFKRKLRTTGFETVGISFKHSNLVVDVLWGQLRRLERSLAELMERNEFQLGRTEVWSDENLESIILVEVERFELPPVLRHTGPPVSNRAGSEAFLQRHFGSRDTVNGPWIEKDRWMVEKQRENIDIHDLIKSSIRNGSKGLMIPEELRSGFHKTWKVHRGKQLLTLVSQADFNRTLWNFLEVRPSWMSAKAHRLQSAS